MSTAATRPGRIPRSVFVEILEPDGRIHTESITRGAFNVYRVLAESASQFGVFRFDNVALQEGSGRARLTVFQRIQDLVDTGWIRRYVNPWGVLAFDVVSGESAPLRVRRYSTPTDLVAYVEPQLETGYALSDSQLVYRLARAFGNRQARELLAVERGSGFYAVMDSGGELSATDRSRAEALYGVISVFELFPLTAGKARMKRTALANELVVPWYRGGSVDGTAPAELFANGILDSAQQRKLTRSAIEWAMGRNLHRNARTVVSRS